MTQIMQKISKSSYFEFLLISSSATLLILSLFYIGLIFYDFAKFFTFDSQFYLNISYNPFLSTSAPYMYRILTPILVFILPFKHTFSFILINLSALILTSILFYYYLRKLNFTQVYSFIGFLFFIFSLNVLYSMYNIALIDPISFLLFLLALYAILHGNDKLYLFTLVFGILNKETILFTLPIYFLCKLENESVIQSFKSTVLLIIPALIILISLRYYFGLNNSLPVSTVPNIIIYQITSNNVLAIPYLGFGVLWIIGFYNIKNNENIFLKKTLYILPLIFLQIFIATDTLRSLFIVFPIIIPFSLYIYKIKDSKLIFMFLMVACLLFYYSIAIIIPYYNLSPVILTSNIYLNSYIILPSQIFVILFLSIYLFKIAILKDNYGVDEIQ